MTFVDRIGMSIEDLGYDFLVLTLARAIFTFGVCVSGVVVLIQQRILLTNFIVLPMRPLDAIFSMDLMA